MLYMCYITSMNLDKLVATGLTKPQAAAYALLIEKAKFLHLMQLMNESN